MNKRRWLPLTFALLAMTSVSCRVPESLLEPSPDDEQDGYESYSASGPDTKLDTGPDNLSMLQQYNELNKRLGEMERENTRLNEKNLTLEAQLTGEQSDLDQVRRTLAQVRAQYQQMQQQNRALEAQILTLSIENAKLEQESLLGKIAQLNEALEQISPNTVDAASPPAGGRR